MKIIKASVFDPALSERHSELPARLELLVSDIDLIEPSFIDYGSETTVFNYGPVMRIFNDADYWDSEDMEGNAANFNTLDDCKEPVFPVTISEQGGMFLSYYMRVKRVKRILAKVQADHREGYELLPDPTWAIEKKNGWYLQHSTRACVDCASVQAEAGLLRVDRFDVRRGRPIEVQPHRLACLCHVHESEFRREAYEQRNRDTE
jgi:hypothetical protein